MSNASEFPGRHGDMAFDPGDFDAILSRPAYKFSMLSLLQGILVDPVHIGDALIYQCACRVLMIHCQLSNFRDAAKLDVSTLDSLESAICAQYWTTLRLSPNCIFTGTYLSECAFGNLSGVYFQECENANALILDISGERLRLLKKHFDGVSDMCGSYSSDIPLSSEVWLAMLARNVHKLTAPYTFSMLQEKCTVSVYTFKDGVGTAHPVASIFSQYFETDGSLKTRYSDDYSFPTPGYFCAIGMRIAATSLSCSKFKVGKACFSDCRYSGSLVSCIRFLMRMFVQHQDAANELDFLSRVLNTPVGLAICDVFNGMFAGCYIADASASIIVAFKLFQRFAREFYSRSNRNIIGVSYMHTMHGWMSEVCSIPMLVAWLPSK
jgi:hypothetical protein